MNKVQIAKIVYSKCDGYAICMGISDMVDLTLKYAQPYIFVNAQIGCRDR